MCSTRSADGVELIRLSQATDSVGPKEGFTIKSADGVIDVVGNDGSGVIYGCQELVDRLEMDGSFEKLPASFSDAPEMVLRGACVGVQKPYLLPGRAVYEYPYTPENFPWFYDKELWIKYLDMLVENRMNSLYLWNGHPFASLVKLEDYPFAVEVDEETFKKNEEMFSFLTTEADKRGIFVIQMFYNILLSKPFAEHYGLKDPGPQPPHHSARERLHTQERGGLHREISQCWSACVSRRGYGYLRGRRGVVHRDHHPRC